MSVNNSYINIEFGKTQNYSLVGGDRKINGSALATLDAIIYVLEKNLSCTDTDEPVAKLGDAANTITTKYLQKTEQLNKFQKIFGRVRNKERKIQDSYRHIMRLVNPAPVFGSNELPHELTQEILPHELTQEIMGFLEQKDMVNLGRTSFHGQQQSIVQKAKRWGYEGEDFMAADRFLRDLYLRSTRTLIEFNAIPKKYIVYKQKEPNIEETYQKIQQLSEKKSRELKALLSSQWFERSDNSEENRKLVLSLIALGANPNVLDSNLKILKFIHANRDIMPRLLNLGLSQNLVNNNGKSVLELMIDDPEIVELFLQHGVDPKYVNKALERAVKANKLETVKLLLKYGADANGHLGAGKNRPLHRAVSSGYLDIAEELVNAGAEIDAQNNLGETALHIAAYFGNKRTVEFLLKNNANPNINNNEHETPIVRSVNNHDVTELLIKYGASEGSTALCYAVNNNRLETVKVLLKYGTPQNIWIDGIGYPIHLAVSKGYIDIVQMLAGCGDEKPINWKNRNGQTPLQLAISEVQIEAAEVLLKHGAKLNAEEGSSLLHL